MKTKRLQDHIDQLLIDFDKLGSDMAKAAAPAVAPAIAEPAVVKEAAVAVAEPAPAEPVAVQEAKPTAPSVEGLTFREVLATWPKEQPLSRAAAELVGSHTWGEFVSSLGRKPDQAAVAEVENRFLQAVEVLAGMEPALTHRFSGAVDSDATPNAWGAGWRELNELAAKRDALDPQAALLAEPKTEVEPMEQAKLERDAFAELAAEDPETDALVEKFLNEPEVKEACQAFETYMLESGAHEVEPEPFEAEAAEPDLQADPEPQAAGEEYDPMAALYEKYEGRSEPAEPAEAKALADLTSEDLMALDGSGSPRIFAVILDGRIDELAPGVVTEDVCLAADEHGNNAAHYLARYPQEIPEAFQGALTEAVLSAPVSFNGKTPAHEFATAGMINLLPEEALTPALLTTVDDYGKTPLDYAEESGTPCQWATELPDEVAPYRPDFRPQGPEVGF